MDWDAVLAHPLTTVFARVSTPAGLGDWLPDVMRVESGPAARVGIGSPFVLTLRVDGEGCTGTGEVIAYEPPASAAFRIFAGARIYIVRLDCTLQRGGTRLRIHQASSTPLVVDLDRLTRAVGQEELRNRRDNNGGIEDEL